MNSVACRAFTANIHQRRYLAGGHAAEEIHGFLTSVGLPRIRRFREGSTRRRAE